MSSSSNDAEAVVALLLAYRKSQQRRKCLWMRPWLSRRKERSAYHTLNNPTFVLRKLLILRLCTNAIQLNPEKSSILTSNNTLH
ncbi:hypothetical protein E2C01_093844 [Portunus trituberculatus]|uniref:Uncharacterized protein n=1 Tax=Portunus trituberculatus TaxID=210409 RepID=A0A5B7JK72_PORTR|nr:hypothetical protein [Portunus trituberculatus]